MIPILFDYDVTDFTSHGLGDLIDTIEANSEVNEDGEYELAFNYPYTGRLFSELKINRIVVVKANDYDPYQAFRIYSITKPINGICTVSCQHISYDLANVPVKAFKTDENEKCPSAINRIFTNAQTISGMTVDKTNKKIGNFTIVSEGLDNATPQNIDKVFEMEEPASVRAVLLDGDDSIKGVYGGQIVFDNFGVKLKATAGSNRGITINYGIDLIDFEQEENISEMITGILPYYKGSHTIEKTEKDANGNNVTVRESEEVYTYGSIQYAHTVRGITEPARHRIVPVDLTEHFPNQKEYTSDSGIYKKGDTIPPTAAQINTKAQAWIKKEEIGEPEISLTLSYAQLGQDVRLYDQINVHFQLLGIDKSAMVTRYKYDVLNERCVEVEVGKAKDSLAFKLSDASRLKTGLIPPKRINRVNGSALSNGSVGGSKLKSDSVSNWHLGGKSVTKDKMDEDSVDTEQICQNAVEEDELAKDSVVTLKIKNTNVARVKLDTDTQNDLAAIWEIYGLVADWIDTGILTAEHIAVFHKLEVDGTLYYNGTELSTLITNRVNAALRNV